MQSRFTVPTLPSSVKTSHSLPCVSDRHLVSIAQRCAAHGQSGQDAATKSSYSNRPSHAVRVPTQQWVEQTKKFKDAFPRRTVRVRDRRNQVLRRTVQDGLASLERDFPLAGRIGRSLSKAQEHANTTLHLPRQLTATLALKHVQQHLPDVEAVQDRAKQLWAQYETALTEHPMRTKALTSCFGLTVADIVAQALEGSGWDAWRTAHFSSFGLLWHGISGHVWYQFLDKHVMPDKSSTTNAIVSKMVLDQAVWAPINTALFYAYLAMADGRLSSLPDTLAAKLLPTIFAGYALWPMAHLINFKYIPSSQRLLYINVVNLFWTVYLSGMANSSVGVDPVQSQVQKFGLAIPVSHSNGGLPPVAVQPASPPIVNL